MAKPSVDAFLATLVHARKADIERVRAIIRTADPRLSEQVKWNAPSFGYDGEDRITFRLQPGDRVELIFHRGAKPNACAVDFTDPSGLLRMVAADRGVVVLDDDIEAKQAALAKLVQAWMQATA
jgi:hypothetical protein